MLPPRACAESTSPAIPALPRITRMSRDSDRCNAGIAAIFHRTTVIGLPASNVRKFVNVVNLSTSPFENQQI